MTLKGNVIAKLIGRYIAGFASGNANLIAAGTAIYEALAQRIVNRVPVPISSPII